MTRTPATAKPPAEQADGRLWQVRVTYPDGTREFGRPVSEEFARYQARNFGVIFDRYRYEVGYRLSGEWVAAETSGDQQAESGESQHE